MTLGEADRAVRAAARREHRQVVKVAWFTAAYTRRRSLPPLATEITPRTPPTPRELARLGQEHEDLIGRMGRSFQRG